jgi:WD40 repeat protein
VFSTTFSPDGALLITAGEGVGVRLGAADSGDHIRDLATDADRNTGEISPSGRFIATGTDDHEVWLWDTQTGDLLWKVKDHEGTVMDIVFVPGEQRLITCDYHGLIKIRDSATGEPKLTLRGHEAGVRNLAMSPDGRWFVSAGIDKTVRIWSTQNEHGLDP